MIVHLFLFLGVNAGPFKIIVFFLSLDFVLANNVNPDEMQQSAAFHLGLYSQNELSSSIAANFLSHNVLGLDFLFYVIFLLIGIGQLDNDSK